MLAGKSIISRLGIPQTNEQENLYGQQLLPQPATQLPHAVATALPFPGNLNPGTLIPVIVQPRLISSAVYNAPQTGNGRVLTNPVAAGLLRGRGGV